MAQVVITESASGDEAAILTDLNATAGLLMAYRFRSLFGSLYARLALHPDSGSPRPGLGPDIRIGVVSPYIAIYRHVADDDTVTVLRLIHGRRRIGGKLLAEKS
jgi:plasmid stabilization system protein ParE